MAEKESYITGVGAYPTAPDTSVQAFLEQYEGGTYNTPYRKRLLQSDKPGWAWEEGDYYSMKSAYEQWKQNLTNRFNADLKQWETAYNTPLNQSELLESAGYNRNWLQGSANSQVPFSEPFKPMDSHVTDYSPSDQIIRGIDNVLSSVAQVFDLRDKEASIDLKQAQAEQIESLIPFKMVEPYWKQVEKLKMHGLAPSSESDVIFFDFGNRRGITSGWTPDDSLFNRFQLIQQDKLLFQNAYIKASTKERNYFIDTIRPIQADIFNLQKKLLDGDLTQQGFDIQVREKVQPILTKQAQSKAVAGMIQPWVDMITQGIGAFLGIKKFGLDKMKFGLDWLDKTGEVLPGMPGN